jgi:hypothetical protein
MVDEIEQRSCERLDKGTLHGTPDDIVALRAELYRVTKERNKWRKLALFLRRASQRIKPTR